ncbi:hypothetical protein C0Q70_07537 [Pomacea canaliculata]|uniref:G-protein coupled receptors family 2 profile 2 domain-containing protein n=1 Tax=Pomacea canaliculata TaxID=400727 RepID=A0A2T7PFB3_POMCA|nr:hypothetical protein C0Q70_07537 [Pomacea canaliculata]
MWIRCDNSTGRVEYPSQEVCEKVRDPCSVVEQFNEAWPFFLRCSQPYFKRNCSPLTYDQVKFNTTAECKRPLVRTDNSASWWEGLDGCGVQCQNPLFTESEHEQVHVLVAVLGSLCVVSTLFTVLTFMIDWQNANRYPALILFFINICFLLGSVGWMAQSGETAACATVFVVIYYFMMAGLLWFVMLCYAWHLTFRALGTPRDDLASKTAYFHLVSWSLPLVLTIVCLAISEIDGDSLSGICFVGFRNHTARAGFVLVPVGCVLVGGLFYLIKGIFSALSLIFGIFTFSVHIYIFVCEYIWQSSFKDYITVFRKPSNKPVQLRRHRMIAQAFRRRRDLSDGRLSMSFHSTHDDPLGMKFDLHSVTSNMSNMSNFAHNIPRLVRRRGGLMHPTAGTFRRYSDSVRPWRRWPVRLHRKRELLQQRRRLGGRLDQTTSAEKEEEEEEECHPTHHGARTVRHWARPGTPSAQGLRRGSDTSVLSKASAQGIKMHLNQQNYGITGSMSSLPGMEHVPAWALAAGSISDVAAGAAAHRSSRRKIPRLEPVKRSSSSRASSFSQFAVPRQAHHHHHQFSHVPYMGVYPGYDYSNLQLLYPGMYLSHPQVTYPFWQPSAYGYPPAAFLLVAAPPPPPLPCRPPTSPSSAPGAGLPGATSTPDAERRRVLTASTSRRSEVTVETQQQTTTEIIPLEKIKTRSEFRKPVPLHDQSVEDLNSSELEDSGAETADMESEKIT